MAKERAQRAVLGRDSARSLLALAAQEALVGRARGDDDGMFEQLERHSVPRWLQRQLFEQLILSPSIVTDAPECELVVGDLMEDGTVTRVAPTEPTIMATSFALAPVLGILAAAGIELTEEELRRRCAWAIDEASSLEAALQQEGLTAKDLLGSINQIGLFFRLALDHSINRRDELRERLQRLNATTTPITNAFAELSRAMHLADRERVERLFLPRSAAAGPDEPFANPAVDELSIVGELAVLRVVTESLGRLPHRATLAETLVLAHTAAAEDLRHKLFEWTEELPSGPTGVLERIERDVRRAIIGLAASSDALAGGRIVTYLGGAALPIELLLDVPPASGIVITIAGVACQLASDAVSRHFRWASFGNN